MIIIDFVLVVQKKLKEVHLLSIDTSMDQSGVPIALDEG